MNPGNWAACLCVHHCPFLHTCRIYLHDPQKTLLATTSNDKVGLEEHNTAPHFAGEVHQGVHFNFYRVPEGAPLLICGLGQVLDTPQVPWQALAEMSLWAIWKLENPPQYRVAIHHTIVQKRRCDPRCLPELTRTMLAPSMNSSCYWSILGSVSLHKSHQFCLVVLIALEINGLGILIQYPNRWFAIG